MAPDVIKVKVLPDYCLVAEFDTGELRWFDMKPFLDFPAFSALKSNSLFRKASVVYGAVTWSDDIDLSPDTLYIRGRVP